MGQRFQSVFILPPIEFAMDNNPNNRSEKVLVFHNQWLYGRGAININLSIIERLKKAIQKRKDCGPYARTKQDFINHFLENSLLNAIKWASVQNLHNETRFSESGVLVYSDEEKKPKEEQKSLSDLLIGQDNNNGFFICVIDKNLKIEYAFINGLEELETYKQQKPKEYLNLFYKEEELKKEGLFEPMLKQIKKFNKFKEIQSINLIPILKDLNEHKPKWAEQYYN